MLEPLYNVVINDGGTLKELAYLNEHKARELLEMLEAWLDSDDPPEGPEAVEELADSIREWLGDDPGESEAG